MMEKGRKKNNNKKIASSLILHVHVPLFVAAHTYTPTYILLSIEIIALSILIPLPSVPSPVGSGPRGGAEP